MIEASRISLKMELGKSTGEVRLHEVIPNWILCNGEVVEIIVYDPLESLDVAEKEN